MLGGSNSGYKAAPSASANVTSTEKSSARERWRTLMFDTPRALLVLYTVKLLFSFAHFTVSLVLTLWLSQELGMSDSRAGWTFGIAGLFATVWGVLCGALIDRAGVKRSLLAGACIATIARAALLVVRTPTAACAILWLIMPAADALGIPVMSIGIKRCVTHTRARSTADVDALAFSVFYAAQNIAALFAGLGVDFLRANIHAFKPLLALFGAPPTEFRAVFLAGAITTAICALLVLFCLDDVDAGIAFESTTASSLFNAVSEVWSQPRFRRFAKLACLLLGVSMIYRHLDSTLPKYMVRVFGADAPYGRYYSLEPAVVVLAVPVFGTLLANAPVYTVLVFGSAVAALSPFWMCIADKYTYVALFVVTLSLGESIYSPRVYQYTMNVARTGSEGVYSALGNAPLFATNLVAGTMSGYLLEAFVPEQGVKRPQFLWGTVGALCVTSPLLMALFRRHVEERNDDYEVVLYEDDSDDELALSLANTQPRSTALLV